MNVTFESEKELEDFICENFIDEIAKKVVGHETEASMADRQVNFGYCGRPDIVIQCAYKDISGSFKNAIIIVELKNVPVKAPDFAQLTRYMGAITNGDNFIDLKSDVFGVLLGPDGIDDSALMIEFMKNIYFFDIGFKENKFNISKTSGWHRLNEGFDFKHAIDEAQKKVW